MAKIPPDFSFVRHGQPLSNWLLDLVAEDRPQDMRPAKPWAACGWDCRVTGTGREWSCPTASK